MEKTPIGVKTNLESGASITKANEVIEASTVENNPETLKISTQEKKRKLKMPLL